MPASPIELARSTADGASCLLLPALANRHGLVAGATGTGKTVTLQKLAESFSALGVPVFVSDAKGDLSGIGAAGSIGGKLAETLQARGLPAPQPGACPVTFWDVFGERGHPVRATISAMGPLLLSRLLELNDTQSGVLTLAFKIADDDGLLLLDLKDLRAMLQHVGEHSREFSREYGTISKASIGAIQRALLALGEQGADKFFGEPALDLADMMQTVQTANGTRGVVNVLAAERLLSAPRLYATFLLWMLSELYESLPEVGDQDKPKFVFFFDEAHLLFRDAPRALMERVELVVRLIRSKGVGVYFVTQNPTDVPDTVLSQLGNRVQHALRAFSARDQKAVRACAQTMRPNPAFDTEKTITELGTGEALISVLDAKGTPGITQRAWVIPPGSRIGPLTDDERAAAMRTSLVAGVYDTPVDRESAYELLLNRQASASTGSAPAAPGAAAPQQHTGEDGAGLLGQLATAGKEALFGRTGPRGGHYDGMVQRAVKSEMRRIGRPRQLAGRQRQAALTHALRQSSRKF